MSSEDLYPLIDIASDTFGNLYVLQGGIDTLSGVSVIGSGTGAIYRISSDGTTIEVLDSNFPVSHRD